MIFYLGTHMPGWLGRLDVPLFVSHRRLCRRKTLPRAKCRWALDSGGFSELSLHGRWTVTADAYASAVGRYREEVGRLDWAACQDWMCEPAVRARTGLSVREHQRRTVESYLELRSLSPGLPWAPVLQGWEYGDYLRHAEGYARAGVDLASLPVVGLGSVCRRGDTTMADELIRELMGAGLRVHAFGYKVLGLRRSAASLASSDSLAWSFQARRKGIRMPGCSHPRCGNCERWAMAWRDRVLAEMGGPVQPTLF